MKTIALLQFNNEDYFVLDIANSADVIILSGTKEDAQIEYKELSNGLKKRGKVPFEDWAILNCTEIEAMDGDKEREREIIILS